MSQPSLKSLFQKEFTRMVAVIAKRYGLQDVAAAEDLVSETFLLAAETWGTKGVPDNPEAWLYTVARQKALYQYRRARIYEDRVLPEWTAAQEAPADELDFSQENIRDSQLRMLFAVCTPAIAAEAQIGLALRILCGFGLEDIAEAFLSNRETVNKRLTRAREKLRTEGVSLEFPAEEEMEGRLDNVLRVIYLLFSEGYYSRAGNTVLRQELCLEALRLGQMLTAFGPTDQPKTSALMALMCFHASRFPARDVPDNPLYDEQDVSRWDKELIHQGQVFLGRSLRGSELSPYHLEARIAMWHCQPEEVPEKWPDILALYDLLLRVHYSPAAALNRLVAYSKVHGAEAAIPEALALGFDTNHFYFLVLGELYREIDAAQSRRYWQQAADLTRNPAERDVILRRLAD